MKERSKKRKPMNKIEVAWTRLLLRYNAAMDQYRVSDSCGCPDAGAMERIRDTLRELAEVAEWNRQVILERQRLS